MVSIGTLVGYLVLEDKLSPALKIAQANVSTAAKSLDKLGDSLSKAGHAMLPISAGVTAAGVAAFKFGKDFETTLTQIRTLVGESAEQVDSYKTSVLALSKDVAKSPQELAEALYFITSSGQKGADALRTLEVSAKASALGLGETKTVADAATSAMNAYGKENLTSEEAVRVLVATVREGKGEADALAGSFGRVIPIAAEMGVRFQDLGAFMAATTKIGLTAEESATALRGALTTISAPTVEQTKAFADLSERGLLPLGFNLEDIRKKIREQGLAEGFMQLTEATKGNSEALTAIIGNVRAATGVLGAYGKQGQETLRIQGLMRTDLHEVDEGFKLVSATVDFKWNQALADMQHVAINAFDAIKPSFINFLDGLSGITKGLDILVSGFKMLPGPVQTAIVAMLGLTALAGPALIAAGAAFKGLSVALDGLKIGLGWIATNGPAVAGALTLIGQAAAILGAFIAGWKIGTAISDLKLFGDEQMSVGESFSFGLLKIQQWTGFLDASDADIENAVLAQRNHGKAITDTAAAFDIATLAAKGYEECLGGAVTASEQAKNLTGMFKSEMAELQQQVLNLTTEQREAIQTGLAMEKNTADIAAGLGVTEAAVKAYAAGFKEANQKVDEFLDNQRKSIEETRKLGEELKQATVQQTGTDQEARLAAIDQWFNDEVAAITGVGDVYKAHYAMLEQLREARRAGELSNISAMNSQSLEALQERAAKERQTYDDMLTSGKTFSREVLDAQLEKVRALEQAARDYGHAFAGAQEEGAQAAKQTNDFFDHMYDTVEQTLERMGKLKKAVSETFSMDIQPLTQTQIKDVQTKFDLHGALTGADPTEALRRKLKQLEGLEGTYAPKSAQQYKSMIDDQVLLSQLRQMGLNNPTESTDANRVLTSRSTGSMPTSTDVPSGGAGGGASSGGVVMNNYINGTGDQVARTVSSELMRVLKVGRQFGTA